MTPASTEKVDFSQKTTKSSKITINNRIINNKTYRKNHQKKINTLIFSVF
jgi:hypothetical protein